MVIISDTNQRGYTRFKLYSFPEKFYVESVAISERKILEIDRLSEEHSLSIVNDNDFAHISAILQTTADVQYIQGIMGIINLVSGPHLIVIKSSRRVGVLNNANIYHIKETDLIPFKNDSHLNNKQKRVNRHFFKMVQLVLSTGGFYYSSECDLSHSLQFLSRQATADFYQKTLFERANEKFLWNKKLCEAFNTTELSKFAFPVIHGFVGTRRCTINNHSFKLHLISRRSVKRAGARLHVRGADRDGNCANFVETEQIIEYKKPKVPDSLAHSQLTSLVQFRGSIPLIWSQKPNLRWVQEPCIYPLEEDQVQVFSAHFKQLQKFLNQITIINLVDQSGSEQRLGSQLEQVANLANMADVKYLAFDFHRGSSELSNWMKRDLGPDIRNYSFLSTSIDRKDGILVELTSLDDTTSESVFYQTGIFRTNCMDCLDRTNVVQSMIGLKSLVYQLKHLHIISEQTNSLDHLTDFVHTYRNLWADNGDNCSEQYAGTVALKTDYTRDGKRTYRGALKDRYNALTRYFKSNFRDGYRQDAIDLFLGNYTIDPVKLPEGFNEQTFKLDLCKPLPLICTFLLSFAISFLLSFSADHGHAFSVLAVIALMYYIIVNGEDFVDKPKLKHD